LMAVSVNQMGTECIHVTSHLRMRSDFTPCPFYI
jgi:hypothetical protein